MGEIGIERAIESVKKTFEKSPTPHFVVEDVLSDHDKLAARITIHRENSDPNRPLPLLLEIFRIENNQIIEIWGAGISSEKFPEK